MPMAAHLQRSYASGSVSPYRLSNAFGGSPSTTLGLGQHKSLQALFYAFAGSLSTALVLEQHKSLQALQCLWLLAFDDSSPRAALVPTGSLMPLAAHLQRPYASSSISPYRLSYAFGGSPSTALGLRQHKSLQALLCLWQLSFDSPGPWAA